ncbi:appetite-regulating hormone isoform X2 [Myotis myotis]|uniref:appetite-regulating hormone isoform X2 n=1 Tax=Myotis myotis TaxID=51298 RepID=UPI0017488E5A|nr:appetite-regulating hormone isoform X2 [Myotis myotis]
MPAPGTICSLLLLSVLWVDLAMAGSSFLSPEHQKAQRKESKKPPAKLQPRERELEGWLLPEDGNREEGAEDELEIRFNAPFDVGIKLSGAQSHWHGQALGKFLQDMFWEEANETTQLSPDQGGHWKHLATCKVLLSPTWHHLTHPPLEADRESHSPFHADKETKTPSL